MDATEPAKIHAQITDRSSSARQRYQHIVLGSGSLRLFLSHELVTGLLGGWPGAMGLWLRGVTYPGLLKHAGRGVIFGRDITLRHPKKVAIGDDVVVDDYCVLDARGDANEGIVIGNEVMLARSVVLECKNGDIRVGDHVGVGAFSSIVAVGRSGVSIGNNVAIGAYAHLVGGSHYRFGRTDIPITRQGLDLRGGIRIGDNAWLGARVTVLDGVTIGGDAIVGAGAVVTKDVPEYGIAVGIPARVVQIRQPTTGVEGQSGSNHHDD